MAKQFVTNPKGEISFQAMLETIGEVTVEELRKGLEAYNITASGGNIIPDAIRFQVKGLQVSVFAPDYYRWIESGRGPGKRPPISKLIDWGRRKGIASDNLNRFAWAVSTIIAKRGVRPRPFVRDAVERAGSGPVAEVFRFEVDSQFEAYLRARLNA